MFVRSPWTTRAPTGGSPDLPRLKEVVSQPARIAASSTAYPTNRVPPRIRSARSFEPEGLVWAVPKRGTIVRYGMGRSHRMRGNLVKRNVATDGTGYSFPSESGQEVWRHHITPTAKRERLDDARIARLLKVPAGSEILLRHQVTGPEAEPPFQISNSWIHPRVADVPGVAGLVPGPVLDWIYRIEKARSAFRLRSAPGGVEDVREPLFVSAPDVTRQIRADIQKCG